MAKVTDQEYTVLTINAEQRTWGMLDQYEEHGISCVDAYRQEFEEILEKMYKDARTTPVSRYRRVTKFESWLYNITK